MNFSGSTWRRITAMVAMVQGTVLAFYGVTIGVVAVSAGLNGPAEVSSPAGVAVETISYIALGVGLVWVGLGYGKAQGWASSPFVLAQILGIAIGLPLAQATDVTGQTIGYGILISVALGLVGFVMARVRAPAAIDLADERKSPQTSKTTPSK